MNTLHQRLSLFSFWTGTLLLLWAQFFFYPRWQKTNTEAAIAWDVSGYYWYLPSVFIYHDLKGQHFKDSVLHQYRPSNEDFQQGFLHKSGNYVMKYSSGMALMYFPFFAAAHLYAPIAGYPPDGFSLPYQIAISFGGLLISLIGLWYFRKFLLRYYSDQVTAWLLLLLVAGTNYLNYAGIDTGMSHTWLFTLYVFLLLNTDLFYQTHKRKYALRIGLIVGLATLTRPTEIISVLLPLLWGLNSLSIGDIRKRLLFFVDHKGALLSAVLIAAAVMMIQSVYWKYASGDWIVYSYQDQGFNWLRPHIKQYPFNYETGWITYCPMLLLPFVSLLPFWVKKTNRVAILSFFLINFYIVSAWNVWQYGGRAMVQSYPVQFFILGALIEQAMRRNWLKLILFPVVALFLYLNIWVVYHYHAGQVDLSFVTKEFYWRALGRWKLDPEINKLKDTKEIFTGTAKSKTLLFSENFERDSMVVSETAIPVIEGKGALLLTASHQESPHWKLNLSPGKAGWMRVQATFRIDQKEWDHWKQAQLTIVCRKADQELKRNMIRVQPFMNGYDTRIIHLDARLPSNCDAVEVFFWNAESGLPLMVDDLSVWTFDE